MNISFNSTNFTGVRLINPAYEHAKYVNNVLKSNGIYVSGHKTYKTLNTFESKQNIANFVREENGFADNECGIIFLPWSNETWIIGKKSFEQKIKKILDAFFIDSEINIGI